MMSESAGHTIQDILILLDKHVKQEMVRQISSMTFFPLLLGSESALYFTMMGENDYAVIV